jgi:putative transposase
VQREEARLSVSRQCQLLSLPRSTLCYKPQGTSAEELATMKLIDEQ